MKTYLLFLLSEGKWFEYSVLRAHSRRRAVADQEAFIDNLNRTSRCWKIRIKE